MMFNRINRATKGSSMERLQNRKGMTMVMMLILLPIIMILAVSFVDPIIRSYRAAANDQKTLLASAVTDSMFEIALWESRGGGTGGVTHNAEWPNPTVRDFDFGTAEATWSVFGTPETDAEHLIVVGSDEWYTVPSLGSGDAGGDYCSTTEPVIDDLMLAAKLNDLIGDDGVIDDPFDWPCHWEKIREGESVVIPLFTEDSDGVVSNPADLGLSNFELRFRAACDPLDLDALPGYGNTICRDDQRFLVKGDPNTQNETVIVLWEIVGDEVDAGGVPTGEKVILGGYTDGGWINSLIYNKNINDYKTSSKVLKENSATEDNVNCYFDNIINHLSNTDICPNTQNIHRPYLNLLVVHTLRQDNPAKTIPYLEYQFKATLDDTSEAPISSTSKVVRVDVMVNGGYSETLEKTIALPKPVSGFVISQ